MTHLVSIRIDDQTLDEAKKLKINYAEVMREALRNEIEKIRERDLLVSLSRINHLLNGVDKNQLLNDLRKDRDER